MNITEELDGLRQAAAGCNAVALVDVSTGMVLSTSSASRRPQEEFDALAGTAREVLVGSFAEAALHNSEDGTTDDALDAVLLGTDETRVFLRAAPDRAEALICVCAPEANLTLVYAKGRHALRTIMADA